jgi:hypothetical protein
METRYITFGFGTPMPKGMILEITGDSENEIRIAMNIYYKSWAGCYDKRAIDTYITNYGGTIHQCPVTAEDIIAEWGQR